MGEEWVKSEAGVRGEAALGGGRGYGCWMRVYESLQALVRDWRENGGGKDGDVLTAYLSEYGKTVRRPVPQKDPPLDGVARDGSIGPAVDAVVSVVAEHEIAVVRQRSGAISGKGVSKPRGCVHFTTTDQDAPTGGDIIRRRNLATIDEDVSPLNLNRVSW